MNPIFPESQNITIQDKELFDSYFSRYHPDISELSFTNLFSWRLSKGYQFSLLDGHLLIFYIKDKKFYLQPVGPEPEIIIKQILDSEPQSVFIRVDAKIASSKSLADLDIKRVEDMDDYVHSVEELKLLKGTKFQAKRNFIRRCEELNPEISRLDESNIGDFLLLQRSWCNFRNCFDDPDMRAECSAIIEAFSNVRSLGFEGICIKIDGKPAGFAVYEKLNDDTYVEHFEKADPNFVGINQYLLFKLVESLPAEARFLNREQDLGIPGLRKAKKSWNPVKMIEKYSISKPI